jgi:hypothetical protein
MLPSSTTAPKIQKQANNWNDHTIPNNPAITLIINLEVQLAHAMNPNTNNPKNMNSMVSGVVVIGQYEVSP